MRLDSKGFLDAAGVFSAIAALKSGQISAAAFVAICEATHAVPDGLSLTKWMKIWAGGVARFLDEDPDGEEVATADATNATDATPGSRKKFKILADRWQNRQRLWHPDDNTFIPDPDWLLTVADAEGADDTNDERD